MKLRSIMDEAHLLYERIFVDKTLIDNWSYN